ncbi:hypothetical protein F66182_4223 [Fusarium sp. NRRL 66182]|nr:hypothetical protein F66182_4223 [Fusarium sp. NRRL 66182]
MPSSMSDEDAATQGIAMMTTGIGSYRTLEMPLPGHPPQQAYPIFIYGGSTAIDISSVQFAKLSGVTVITTSSASDASYLKSLGADHVLDYVVGMSSPQTDSDDSFVDEDDICTAGSWLVSLCNSRGPYITDQVLTPLEQLKFDEFFAMYRKSRTFKRYHVEAVRQRLAKEPRAEYQLARVIVEKDDENVLFAGRHTTPDDNKNIQQGAIDDVLQVLIKPAKLVPYLLGQDPKESCPELLDMAKLLIAHGASIHSFDSDGYSPLFYACVLGYEELFRYFIESGADVSTMHKRITPQQLANQGEESDMSSNAQHEMVNLLQVTCDALLSPQNIVEMTWVGWPPGVDFDTPLWNLDMVATWRGIISRLLEKGLPHAKDDPGLIMLLHIACYRGELGNVNQLLESGVAANVAGPRMADGGQGRGPTFGTAMHAAAAGRQLSVISTLISHGESPSSRRLCIFDRGRLKGDLTPVEVAIQASRYDDDGDEFLDFLEEFMSLSQDLDTSDYQAALECCINRNNLHIAKRLLGRGIRLPEAPCDVPSVEMAQLLNSYDIELNPGALQSEALRGRRVDLLRWCVNEYGPLLPSDPKSWGHMVHWLISGGGMCLDAVKYLITEYPGPDIDTVLTAEIQIDDEKKPTETSWLHIAILQDGITLIRMLLEAGADPACPGLLFDASEVMRRTGRRDLGDVPERLEVVEMIERRASKTGEWRIPSYAEIMSRISETVQSQRRVWDSHIEYMVKHRQHVPQAAPRQAETPTSPSTLGRITRVTAYQPLDSSSSFRTLELLPAESRTDPLVGRLINNDITFQSDYEALSYVWGDTSPARYISIDEEDMEITPNLYSALVHLRDTQEVRALWVDAVCINQAVHGERNQQVRIMGDIYRSARQVIVWLGDAADDSHLVFEHLKDDTVQQSLLHPPPPEDAKRKAWNALIKRPWFYRTWVIQEITLARRAVVMCGEDSTLWRNRDESWKPDFSGGARGLSSIRSAPGNKPDHPISGFDPDGHVWRLRLLDFGSDPMSILRYSRVCQTTEVRDKIFGILGLFKPGFIKVDYDMPVEDIFRHFTEAVIRLTGDLRILMYLGVARTYDGLPSWVPDFTDISTRSLPERPWYAPYREDTTQDYKVRTADGTRYELSHKDLAQKYLPGLSFLEDGGLVVNGKMIDVIRDIGPELSQGTTHIPGTDAFIHVLKEWESLAATLIPEWQDSLGPSVTHAFAATLSAADGSEIFSVDAGFTQWYRHCGTGILESADPSKLLRDYEFFMWWMSIGQDDQGDGELGKLEYNISKFAQTSTFASYGRCFTTKGGTMGFARPGARAGDHIVYLPGADDPFVLRRRMDGKSWTLVNYCYQYGLNPDLLFLNTEHLVEEFVIY